MSGVWQEICIHEGVECDDPDCPCFCDDCPAEPDDEYYVRVVSDTA